MKRIFLFPAVGLLLLIGAGHALAHGEIVQTNPPDGSELEAAPETVQIWFDQPIIRNTAEITVINSSGQRVDQGEVQFNPNNPSFIEIALQPDLPDGAYIITASAVVVSDGHNATGSSVFWIGSKQAAAQPVPNQATPAYKVAGFLIGLMLVAGLSGYWLFFQRTASLEITQPAQDVSHFPLE